MRLVDETDSWAFGRLRSDVAQVWPEAINLPESAWAAQLLAEAVNSLAKTKKSSWYRLKPAAFVLAIRLGALYGWDEEEGVVVLYTPEVGTTRAHDLKGEIRKLFPDLVRRPWVHPWSGVIRQPYIRSMIQQKSIRDDFALATKPEAFPNPKAKRKENKKKKAELKGKPTRLPNFGDSILLDSGLEEARGELNSWPGATHLEWRLYQRLGIAPEYTKQASVELLDSLNHYKPAKIPLIPQGGTFRALLGIPGLGMAFLWGWNNRIILRSWWPVGSEQRYPSIPWPVDGIRNMKRIIEKYQRLS